LLRSSNAARSRDAPVDKFSASTIIKTTFARVPPNALLRPTVGSISTANADADRVALFGFGSANVGFLRTRAAGRKTRATGNPAPIRNGPRRCVRRKRAPYPFESKSRVFNFFPFANVFLRKIFPFFANVRVAVIDALRRIGRRLNGKAPPFLTVDLQREPIFATLSKESNVPSFAVAIPR